jgi:putative NADH-flavin reductase
LQRPNNPPARFLCDANPSVFEEIVADKLVGKFEHSQSHKATTMNIRALCFFALFFGNADTSVGAFTSMNSQFLTSKASKLPLSNQRLAAQTTRLTMSDSLPIFEQWTTRRNLLGNSFLSIALATPILRSQAVIALENPVTVIGASGYTGGDCVRELVARNLPVRAVSRKPISLDKLPKSLVTAIGADVTVPSSLPAAIQGASSVIFLASARKRFSATGSDSSNVDSYEDVEHLGLINVAKECIRNKVPRLVVVSSSCKCKDGQADKATGMMCDQCSSKRAGEQAVRELYAQAALPEVGYTIVRPGLLNTGERRGVKEVEINQGESKTGVISRLDLADLLLAAASR